MRIKTHIVILVFALFLEAGAFAQDGQKPKIAFTFDDGQTADMAQYKLEDWNGKLLGHLKKHTLKAILFSLGRNKNDAKGKYVLSSWDADGHLIANHTVNHPSFSGKNGTPERFEAELLANDSIIRHYSSYARYFRFPYLKEGNSHENIDAYRQILKKYGYRNGHVSIDASDWYIDQRLLSRLMENPKADLDGFRDFYKQHLMDRAKFYDSLAYSITGRRINHVILLHHNLAAALFLGDLIEHFKNNGWEVIDADRAYEDPIYKSEPKYVPAGESLIWSLAKESGKYEHVLRYPAEDGEYEKQIMDKLGL